MFGPHVNRYHAKGSRPRIDEHIEAARQEADHEADFRMRAAAIFVGGPQERKITLLASEAASLKRYVDKTGIRVVAHSAYSAVPWRGDPDAARHIREELQVCQSAGIVGLVVHLPKLPIESVMKYIGRLYTPLAPDVRVFLETPAVTPRETYYETPEKLAELFKAIREKLDPRLDHFGLCIDSAHLWTCGIDLSSNESAEEWLAALEDKAATIPHDRVMIHLNDSGRPLGVGPDTHAGLASGQIWGDYKDRLDESGLAAFVNYAARHDTIVILERKPKSELKLDYLVLRKLM